MTMNVRVIATCCLACLCLLSPSAGAQVQAPAPAPTAARAPAPAITPEAAFATTLKPGITFSDDDPPF